MLVVVNNNNKIRLTIPALAVYVTTENVRVFAGVVWVQNLLPK